MVLRRELGAPAQALGDGMGCSCCESSSGLLGSVHGRRKWLEVAAQLCDLCLAMIRTGYCIQLFWKRPSVK